MRRAAPDRPGGPGAHALVGLLDLRSAARFLAVSPSTVERFTREGMPALDLGVHHPRRREKRLLRFVPDQILRWVIERGGNGAGAGRSGDGR